MSDQQTVSAAVEQLPPRMLDETRWADVLPAHGHSGGSDCGGVRGIAPPRAISSGLSAALPPYSERWSNNPPQGWHSSTGSVDNSRPPMSRLTAKTLRMAHSKVMNIHRLGGLVPDGLAMLERDYKAWRRRVQRGTQQETLMVVPWSVEVRQP